MIGPKNSGTSDMSLFKHLYERDSNLYIEDLVCRSASLHLEIERSRLSKWQSNYLGKSSAQSVEARISSRIGNEANSFVANAGLC